MNIDWLLVKAIVLTGFELVLNIWLTGIEIFLLDEGARLGNAVFCLETINIWHLECVTSAIVRLLANSLQLILNSFQLIILLNLIDDDLCVFFFILIFILILVFIIVVLPDCRT